MPSARAAIATAGLACAAAVAAGLWLLPGGPPTSKPSRPTRHSEPHVRPTAHGKKDVAASWPTYGADAARTHVAPHVRLRPPFRRLWTIRDPSFFEFPPVVAHDRLYVGTDGGRILAADARTGKVVWERRFGHCIAASPALWRSTVYVALMGRPPCTRGGSGGLVALDASSGRTRWRFAAGVVESSPLVARGTVYFGSWDHRVYALDASSGRVRWTFATGDKVKAGPAWAAGTLYVGSYDGNMYALDGRTGRRLWSAEGGSFYATPTVAYGRVYDGATDGRVYAFGAASGSREWVAATGSFVYAAAAAWRGTIYVGSYDHNFYAFDARTGARRWAVGVGHPISGAPTVLDGLVYFSTCGSCSQYESDPSGRRSYAIDARTGRFVWSFPDGEYSPVVSDGRRVYLMGFTTLYGLSARSES